MSVIDLIAIYVKLGVEMNLDWKSKRLFVMKRINLAKYQQNLGLFKKLMATGDNPLVEHFWKDKFWGDGHSNGSNMMGHILVKVRDELRKNIL
jgi:predicted NAD-dependent protein-ADP-ribosyltransferase YbiA (DUF1768 family)